MPRFAANLTMMFNELPFLERFGAARAAGFEAVEILFPYDHEARTLLRELKTHGLQLVLHNLPPGNWEADERGMACLPGREAEFRTSLRRAIDYAQELGCPRLHVMAGKPPAELARADARACYIENLRHAAEACAAAGIQALIEPINYFDIPGYFLNTTAQALDILDAVGHDSLRIQFDIYHAQRMQGELANTITSHLARIGHMQLADTPGRHEPGTGEINYGFLFRHIDTLGYEGWIGCEYKPASTTLEGLGWLKDSWVERADGSRRVARRLE